MNRSLIHRKRETLRQYILRARDEGLWTDEVAKEGVLVWLDKYDSVRFGGKELTEREFLATMKLVYYLLKEMKPLESMSNIIDDDDDDYGMVDESIIPSSSSSSFSLRDSDSGVSFRANTGLLPPPLSRNQSMRHTTGRDSQVLRQMESLLITPSRKSGEIHSLAESMIDHGSILEEFIDRGEIDRRMRGGRLGEREGSVIYYDIDDDD
jgi:hypothetical protein